jgi:hypothetical protein
MSYQRGSLKKVKRKEGEIWVLQYRVTNSEGRRVENVMPIGLVREFPKDKDARREVDRLGLPVRINDSPPPGRIHFDFRAEHYLKADCGHNARQATGISEGLRTGSEGWIRARECARTAREISGLLSGGTSVSLLGRRRAEFRTD